MKLVAIVAENPNAALMQVHEQLGPDAVVVSVRKLPREGISQFWQKNQRLEVTACIPEKLPEKREYAFDKQAGSASVPPTSFSRQPANETPALPAKNTAHTSGRWRSIAWLESNGLLPAFTNQLEEKIYLLHGEQPLPTPEKEWTAVSDLVICHWRAARQMMTGTGRPHVFIGPAGSGKTTALCKWMNSAVLVNEHRVHVWRLDGETANPSEFLTLHCELMGVPLERFWNEPDETADLQFVDLPGVEINNPDAMSSLRDQLSALPQPHVHLVLNAAYENSILFEQFHAFESFVPEDIIFTHLDEERRRVKLWNFVLGTNCPISFLGAGQKIPGEFRRAEPSLLFPQKNHR
jgi:flagellar biosynthesis protein FlhF